MGDMGDLFNAHRAERKKLHATWKTENLRLLEQAGIPFRMAGGETLCIRVEGKPRVDFYPSTGRWRDIDANRTYNGHVSRFLKWWAKQ